MIESAEQARDRREAWFREHKNEIVAHGVFGFLGAMRTLMEREADHARGLILREVTAYMHGQGEDDLADEIRLYFGG